MNISTVQHQHYRAALRMARICTICIVFAAIIARTDSLAFGSGKVTVLPRNYNPSRSSITQQSSNLLLARSTAFSSDGDASSSPSNHLKTSTTTAYSNKNGGNGNERDDVSTSRRKILKSSLLAPLTVAAATLTTTLTSSPQPASARYVLNEEGEYVELQEEDWKTTWKARLDKAQSMSKDEIFEAARGAGNLELQEGEESGAARKRRAMSACRDGGIRAKVGEGLDLKGCNNRVMAGETDFILPSE